MEFVSSKSSHDLEPQVEKEGTFEWIASGDSLLKFLSPRFTGIKDPFYKEGEKRVYRQSVLVIGCGTSTLSGDIASYKPSSNVDCEKDDLFSAKMVVSIDNDPNIISYMRSQFGGDEKIQWQEYDIVENEGSLSSDEYNDRFDLVVDKGTLDAVLVGGAVYTMLLDIDRLLRKGGAYVVCSIFGLQLLSALLGLKELGWEVLFHTMDNTELTADTKGTIAICKKINDTPISPEALQKAEQIIMDEHFKNESPLLTPEYENNIRKRFQAVLVEKKKEALLEERRKDNTLDSRECYRVLITAEEERLGYDYDLFCEDLSKFHDDDSGGSNTNSLDKGMTVEQCLEFIRIMQ